MGKMPKVVAANIRQKDFNFREYISFSFSIMLNKQAYFRLGATAISILDHFTFFAACAWRDPDSGPFPPHLYCDAIWKTIAVDLPLTLGLSASTRLAARKAIPMRRTAHWAF